MGFNLAGAAAAYQGFAQEQRRIAEDERLADQANRAKNDAAFADEVRNRQRNEWRKADDQEADLRRFNAELDDEYAKAWNDQVPTSKKEVVEPVNNFGADAPTPPVDGVESFPVAAPSPIEVKALDQVTNTKVGGVRGPETISLAPANSGFAAPTIKVADTLGRASKLLDYKLSKNYMDADSWAKQRGALDLMRNEGVHDAIELMAQGQGQAAVEAYNKVGLYRGAQFVGQRQANTTLPTGQTVPTNIVTLRTKDGQNVEVDATLARYNLLKIQDQLAASDRATQLKNTNEYHQGMLGVAKKNAEIQEGYRKDQAAHMEAQIKAQRDIAGMRAAASNQRGLTDAKAMEAFLGENASLYSVPGMAGEKPTENLIAKDFLAKLARDPNMGPQRAYETMATFRDQARKLATAKDGQFDQRKYNDALEASVSAAEAEWRNSLKQVPQTVTQPGSTPSDPTRAKLTQVAPVTLPASSGLTEPLNGAQLNLIAERLGVLKSQFTTEKLGASEKQQLIEQMKQLDSLRNQHFQLLKRRDANLKTQQVEAQRLSDQRDQELVDSGLGYLATDKSIREFNTKANVVPRPVLVR